MSILPGHLDSFVPSLSSRQPCEANVPFAERKNMLRLYSQLHCPARHRQAKLATHLTGINTVPHITAVKCPLPVTAASLHTEKLCFPKSSNKRKTCHLKLYRSGRNSFLAWKIETILTQKSILHLQLRGLALSR